MTAVRREKLPEKDRPVVEKTVTFEESIHFEEFLLLNDSADILVLVGEAHRSNTRALHRNLRKALPNAALIGFTDTPIFSRDKKPTAVALKTKLAPLARESEFVSGENFSFLGHNYRLMLIPQQSEALGFDGQRFLLRKDEVAAGATHFRRWYIEQGREQLTERVEWLARRTGRRPTAVRLRDLGFRWVPAVITASCSSTGSCCSCPHD